MPLTEACHSGGSPRAEAGSSGTPRAEIVVPSAPRSEAGLSHTPRAEIGASGSSRAEIGSSGSSRAEIDAPGAPRAAIRTPDTPRAEAGSSGSSRAEAGSSGSSRVEIDAPGAPRAAIRTPDTPRAEAGSSGSSRAEAGSSGSSRVEIDAPGAPRTDIGASASSRDKLDGEFRVGGPQLVTLADGSLALEANGMQLRADLTRMLPRLRPQNLSRELLVRAARVRGVPHPHVVDATAGLGEDSLLLAAAGFSVTLFEKDPLIAALLRDSLRRAAENPRLAEVVSRMQLIEGDAIVGLAALTEDPDVVYLDPMFPAKRKDAATQKKLQLLRMLERPCTDEDAQALLAAAVASGPRKVVVKRPLKGPHLAGARPSHSLAGKVVRYDIVIP